MFNIIDDFSRECVAQFLDFPISGLRLTRELDRISERRTLPDKIGCDDAQSTIKIWRKLYNHVRPHRSLGSKPPAVFADEAACYA